MQMERFQLPSFEEARPKPALQTVSSAQQSFVPVGGKREAAAGAPAAPAVFSAVDIEAAEKKGYAAGHAAGLEAGRAEMRTAQAEVEKQLQQSAQALVGQIGALRAQCNAYLERQRRDMPKLALEVARKVAGDALRQDPAAPVEQLFTDCRPLLEGEPKVIIAVHESLAPLLEKRLAALAGDLAAVLQVQADAALPAGDARIEWNEGVAERNEAELWKRVEQVISSMAAAAPPTLADAQEPPEGGHHEPKLYIAT